MTDLDGLALTAVRRIRCPGCAALIGLPMLDEFRVADDRTAFECDQRCPRCDTRVTLRLTVEETP